VKLERIHPEPEQELSGAGLLWMHGGGLPPAWIGVGDVDLFLEEDRRYAERLTESGVSCGKRGAGAP
jgi:hypothetical protein